MEKQDAPNFSSFFSFLFSLVCIIISFSCSIAAEFHKAQENDVQVDGTLCSLPKTPSFALGLAALIFLSLAQVLGTHLAFARGRKPMIPFLAVSWGIFGISCVLLGTGTSMNKGQRYGEGWLDGRCYLVRRGVYGAAGALAVLSGFLVVDPRFPGRRLRQKSKVLEEDPPS